MLAYENFTVYNISVINLGPSTKIKCFLVAYKNCLLIFYFLFPKII